MINIVKNKWRDRREDLDLERATHLTRPTDKRNDIHCLPCKTLSKLKSQVDSPIDQLQFKKK